MQAGNQQAFTVLYRHYSPQIYQNIAGILREKEWAEELVQELFTRIWQKKQNKGLTENFSGYLYRAAQNLVCDFFRKMEQDRKLQHRFQELASENYLSIEQAMENAELKAMLQKAINQLSPQQKKAFELVRLEGNSYREAAETMGISPLTIKEYLVNSHKLIRHFILKQTGGQPETILLLTLVAGIF